MENKEQEQKNKNKQQNKENKNWKASKKLDWTKHDNSLEKWKQEKIKKDLQIEKTHFQKWLEKEELKRIARKELRFKKQLERQEKGQKENWLDNLLGKCKEVSYKEITNSTKIWGLVIATILSIGLGVGLGVGLKSSDSNGGNGTQTLPQATMVIYTHLEKTGILIVDSYTYTYVSSYVKNDTLWSFLTRFENSDRTWSLNTDINYTFENSGIWHIEYSGYSFLVSGGEVV